MNLLQKSPPQFCKLAALTAALMAMLIARAGWVQMSGANFC